MIADMLRSTPVYGFDAGDWRCPRLSVGGGVVVAGVAGVLSRHRCLFMLGFRWALLRRSKRAGMEPGRRSSRYGGGRIIRLTLLTANRSDTVWLI